MKSWSTKVISLKGWFSQNFKDGKDENKDRDGGIRNN